MLTKVQITRIRSAATLRLGPESPNTLLTCATRIEYTRSQGYEPRLQGPLCPVSAGMIIRLGPKRVIWDLLHLDHPAPTQWSLRRLVQLFRDEELHVRRE